MNAAYHCVSCYMQSQFASFTSSLTIPHLSHPFLTAPSPAFFFWPLRGQSIGRSIHCKISRLPQATVTRPVDVILASICCCVPFSSIGTFSSIIIVSFHGTISLCGVRLFYTQPSTEWSVPLDAIQEDDFRKSFTLIRSGWCGASATWTWQWTSPPAVWLCQLRKIKQLPGSPGFIFVGQFPQAARV